MAKEDDSKLKIEDPTNAEIYDAIRYLLQDPESRSGEDKGVLICVGLYRPARPSGQKSFHGERLYSHFISESSRVMADAIQHNLADPNQLAPTYPLLRRKRSSFPVLASAEQVLQHIVDTYSEPNLTPKEIQPRAAKREAPLRDFSVLCRNELESLI